MENIQGICQSAPGVEVQASSPQGQAVQCSEKLQKPQGQHFRFYSSQLACWIKRQYNWNNTEQVQKGCQEKAF